jgi:hypothetical protein
MKKLVLILAVTAGVLGLESVALAAPGDPGATEFNFDEDVLTVDYLKPDLEFVAMVEQERMASLIEIRKDFTDEVIKAAEEVY